MKIVANISYDVRFALDLAARCSHKTFALMLAVISQVLDSFFALLEFKASTRRMPVFARNTRFAQGDRNVRASTH
jgi:hypothetical protein